MTLHIANVSKASIGVEGQAGASAINSADKSFQASSAAQSAGSPAKLDFQASAQSATNTPTPSVVVSTGPASGPMNTISTGVVDGLESIAKRRADMRSAGATSSPEAALEAARDALLPGPASLRPRGAEGSAPSQPDPLTTREAISALSDTFDYAIETHVVIKSISQFSSSANQLLKTQ